MRVNRIIKGDVREILPTLPPESVDMIITSPPYWALRAYSGLKPSIWDGDPNCIHEWQTIRTQAARGAVTGDWDRPSRAANAGKKRRLSAFCGKCGAWKGGLGFEPNIRLYIKHLIEIFDQLKTILAPYGTCWVNLGDTYYGSGDHHTNDKKGRGKQYTERQAEENEIIPYERPTLGGELPAKCLSGIPERFVVAMIDHGWIYRNRLIWWKENCIPESMKDRFTVDFEPFYFFTKQEHYYFKQQFEPGKTSTFKRYQSSLLPMVGGKKYTQNPDELIGASKFSGNPIQPMADRTVRSVWRIPAEYHFDKVHFATFPKALVRRPVDAGCPPRVCLKCKQPVKPIWEVVAHAADKAHSAPVGLDSFESSRAQKKGGFNTVAHPCLKEHKFKGWRRCDCKAEFRKGLVLDPFMGSGTVAFVAREQGKDYLGIEIVAKYIKLAYELLDSDQKRITEIT